MTNPEDPGAQEPEEHAPGPQAPPRGREQPDALRKAALVRRGLLAEQERAKREAAEREADTGRGRARSRRERDFSGSRIPRERSPRRERRVEAPDVSEQSDLGVEEQVAGEEVSQQSGPAPSDRPHSRKRKERDSGETARLSVTPPQLAPPVVSQEPPEVPEEPLPQPDFSSRHKRQLSSSHLRRIATYPLASPNQMWWAPRRQQAMGSLPQEVKNQIGTYWLELVRAARQRRVVDSPGLDDQRHAVVGEEVSQQSDPGAEQQQEETGRRGQLSSSLAREASWSLALRGEAPVVSPQPEQEPDRSRGSSPEREAGGSQIDDHSAQLKKQRIEEQQKKQEAKRSRSRSPDRDNEGHGNEGLDQSDDGNGR